LAFVDDEEAIGWRGLGWGLLFPLLQPGRVIVTTKDVTTIQLNPTWSIDVAAVSG